MREPDALGPVPTPFVVDSPYVRRAPLAFFGHSAGALLAFEVARAMAADGAAAAHFTTALGASSSAASTGWNRSLSTRHEYLQEEAMQDIHVQDRGPGRTPLVVVSRDDCIAAGECARIAPAVFDQDEADGTVLLRDGFTAADPQVRKQIRHAVAACPAAALDLVEDD